MLYKDFEYNTKVFFCYKILIFHQILIEYKEPILFLDGDVIIKKNINCVFNLLKKYDILFRYRPILNILGPLGTSDGAKVNSGVVVIANNQITKDFLFTLKSEVFNFLKLNKDPVIYTQNSKVITALDQEIIWNIYKKMRNKIKFLPLDDKFNDSYFRNDSYIWHAKGSARNNIKYKYETYKYNKFFLRMIFSVFRMLKIDLKNLLKKCLFILLSRKLYRIKNLNIELKNNRVNFNNKLTIINSNFLLSNKILLHFKNITCIDTEPIVYHFNKNFINKYNNIVHNFVTDFEYLKNKKIDIIISDNKILLKNVKVKITQKYNKICFLYWNNLKLSELFFKNYYIIEKKN